MPTLSELREYHRRELKLLSLTERIAWALSAVMANFAWFAVVFNAVSNFFLGVIGSSDPREALLPPFICAILLSIMTSQIHNRAAIRALATRMNRGGNEPGK